MLEDNNWYKVMDNSNMSTLIFTHGAIFKVIRSTKHSVKVFSAVNKRHYILLAESMSKLRTVKLDSKAAELLYSKVVV